MIHLRVNKYINEISFQFFRRCFGVKPSNHYDLISKRKSRKNVGEEERVQLLKSRGQHLLINPRVLDAIVRISGIKPDDTVLEIGPGTGNLTLKLLAVAKKVVAIEIDERMVDILRERIGQSELQYRLNIICGDALKVDFPKFDIVVANIPYCISSPLLSKLVFSGNENPFRRATLLLQREFARRLVAKPGDSEFNRLAVNVNMFADVKVVMDVSKRDFVPCPKVDSSIIEIHPKAKVPNVNLSEWWAFTRTCFGKKNRTLGGMFKQKKKLMELMKLSKLESSSEDGCCERYANDIKNLGEEDECESENEGDLNLFRGKIVNLLESNAFLDKRPSKLSTDELLHLLSIFNGAGVYFHDREQKNYTCDDDQL